MKITILVIVGLVVIVAWFLPTICQEIRHRRWRALPNHNPYKRGDHE